MNIVIGKLEKDHANTVIQMVIDLFVEHSVVSMVENYFLNRSFERLGRICMTGTSMSL